MTSPANHTRLGRLAGQVALYPDEALESFLFRSGTHNAIQQISSFRSVLGLAGSRLPADNALQTAAYTLGVNSNDIRRCALWNASDTYRPGYVNWFGTFLPKKLVRTANRRFPVGVEPLPYSPAFWMLPTAPLCPSTLHKLHDYCPVCSSRLSWSAGCELGYCSKDDCRADFSEFDAVPTEEIGLENYSAAFGLIHPEELVRRTHINQLPPYFHEWEAGDVYIALLVFAGATRGLERARAGVERPFVGVRKYESLKAAHLSEGFRVLQDWDESIIRLMVDYQRTVGSPRYRGGIHDLVKYLTAPSIPAPLRALIDSAMPEALRECETAFYAPQASPVLSKAREGLISVGAAREKYRIDNRTLERLVPNGRCFHAKSESTAGPVLFNERLLSTAIQAYRSSMNAEVAGAALGVPSYVISGLADRGILEVQAAHDVQLLAPQKQLVTEESVRRLQQRIHGSKGRRKADIQPVGDLMLWIVRPSLWVALVESVLKGVLVPKVVTPQRDLPTFSRLGLPPKEFYDWLALQTVCEHALLDTTGRATKTDVAAVMRCNLNPVRAALRDGMLTLTKDGGVTIESLMALTDAWISAEAAATYMGETARRWFSRFDQAELRRLELSDPDRKPFLTLFHKADVIDYFEAVYPRACPMRILPAPEA